MMRMASFALLFSLLHCACAFGAIGGSYYITAPATVPGIGNWNARLSGSGVSAVWDQQVSGEYAIAVTNAYGGVRTMANGPTLPFAGAEYTLNGTFTGTTFLFPLESNSDIFDATSDGSYIYAWDMTNGRAYRLSLDWTAPTLLFEISPGSLESRRLGITFDPSNQSLWLSGWSGPAGTLIENRALDGTLLFGFTVSHDRNAALALDPTDQTLWLFDGNTRFSAPTFEQYSRDGQLLSRLEIPSLAGRNILGGEFAPVPEPLSVSIWVFQAGCYAALWLARGHKSVARATSQILAKPFDWLH